MADVHGNPAELKQFATHLGRFSQELGALASETRARMNHLSDSWRDQENAQFAEKYAQAIKPMDTLAQTLDDYREFLMRKAKALEDYLSTRM